MAALVAAVDAGLDRWLNEEHRIGLTEFRVILALSQEPERELRVNDLAIHVGLSPSSVSRSLRCLEVKELVRREVSIEDGRGVYAVLGDRGAAVSSEVFTPYSERSRDLLRELPEHLPHLSAALVASALADVEAVVASS